MKLKPGDKIIRTGGTLLGVKHGQWYTFKDYAERTMEYICLIECNDFNYIVDLFELADQLQSNIDNIKDIL